MDYFATILDRKLTFVLRFPLPMDIHTIQLYDGKALKDIGILYENYDLLSCYQRETAFFCIDLVAHKSFVQHAIYYALGDIKLLKKNIHNFSCMFNDENKF